MESQNAFSLFFMWMGPYKWPMLLMAAIVISLIIYKIGEMFMPNYPLKKRKRGINTILFWGFFSFGMGLFAQFSGLWIVFQEVSVAPDISPGMLITGILGSFCSTLFGLGILLVSALAWWLFRSFINMDEEELQLIV